MEVASPLTFGQSKAGTKRAFGCSPPLLADSSNTTAVSFGGMDVEMPSKRRRFHEPRTDSPETISTASLNPFAAMSLQTKSPHQHHQHHAGQKRARSEDDGHSSSESGLRSIVDQQAAEIEGLKRDKASLESTVTELRGENEKVVSENKILKRAVTIQQERQGQSASELEAARQYKADADERIGKLEQMILTLRYHLQAQNVNPGIDFMGFPPRPPDVY